MDCEGINVHDSKSQCVLMSDGLPGVLPSVCVGMAYNITQDPLMTIAPPLMVPRMERIGAGAGGAASRASCGDLSCDESLPDASVAIVSNMMSGSATQRPVDHARVGPDGRRIDATRRLSRYPARERRRRIYHDLPW